MYAWAAWDNKWVSLPFPAVFAPSSQIQTPDVPIPAFLHLMTQCHTPLNKPGVVLGKHYERGNTVTCIHQFARCSTAAGVNGNWHQVNMALVVRRKVMIIQQTKHRALLQMWGSIAYLTIGDALGLQQALLIDDNEKEKMVCLMPISSVSFKTEIFLFVYVLIMVFYNSKNLISHSMCVYI